MIRKYLFTLIALFIFVLPGAASSTKYYSKLTVKTSDSAMGKVYLSDTEVKDPSSVTYVAEKTSDPRSSTSQTHSYYIYAKPEGDNVFAYWQDENGNQVDVRSNKFDVYAESKSQNSPTTRTLTARFIPRPTVWLKSDNETFGNTVISSLENNAGDEITITAQVYTRNGDYDSMGCRSDFVTFEGWYDQDGNLFCDASECNYHDDIYNKYWDYKFKIDRELELTAKFKYEQTLVCDENGKYIPKYYRMRTILCNYGPPYVAVTGSFTPNIGNTDNSRKVNGVMDLMYKDYSDPQVIFLFRGDGYAKMDDFTPEKTILQHVIMEGQGQTTYELLNRYFELRAGNQPGTYKFYFPEASLTLMNSYGTLMLSGDHSVSNRYQDNYSLYDLEPIDEEHFDKYYFGAKPSEDMYFDEGYWCTMYTGFPYLLYDDDVEAYYIGEIHDEKYSEPIARINKIEGRVVPALTPVLLKCRTTVLENNRLMPITPERFDELCPDGVRIEKNLLEGEFQMNKNASGGGKKTFDGSKMRVFSVYDGKVGFYKLEDGVLLAKNRAWLNISSFGNGAAHAKILLSTGDESGVEDVVVDDNFENDPDAPMYNLMGQRIYNPAPGQIYIQNGRKHVAR